MSCHIPFDSLTWKWKLRANRFLYRQGTVHFDVSESECKTGSIPALHHRQVSFWFSRASPSARDLDGPRAGSVLSSLERILLAREVEALLLLLWGASGLAKAGSSHER